MRKSVDIGVKCIQDILPLSSDETSKLLDVVLMQGHESSEALACSNLETVGRFERHLLQDIPVFPYGKGYTSTISLIVA
jgi:hypothetical protein